MTDLAPPRAPRNDAIDLVRGVVMIVMALDHVRDFFGGFNNSGATNLATTTPQLFFTRWITHFCAPTFVFLAGTAASLWARKHSSRERTIFLLTRGAWLVFLELTVVKLGFTFDPLYRFTFVQVIWAIGWSMIALAALSYLDVRAVAALGLAMIALHNTLDRVHFNTIWWSFVHESHTYQPFPGHYFAVGYPLVPWIGVMACGWSFGALMKRDLASRRAITLRIGLVATALFVALRLANVYGDASRWSAQPRGAIFTVLSFFNTTKYPPSLLYLLMTLGPMLIALSRLDGVALPKWTNPIVVFGRVPLFYYVLHLFLGHAAAFLYAYLRDPSHFDPIRVAFNGAGVGLVGVYVAWILVVAALYAPSKWFAGVKARNRAWWVSYL